MLFLVIPAFAAGDSSASSDETYDEGNKKQGIKIYKNFRILIKISKFQLICYNGIINKNSINQE